MGPMKPKSRGALYVLTFIDDYNRFVYLYVFDRFREFKALAEMQTGYNSSAFAAITAKNTLASGSINSVRRVGSYICSGATHSANLTLVQPALSGYIQVGHIAVWSPFILGSSPIG
ncbi:hypothetical protein PF005_g29538 [Phytophthora fragariae]|nr:hypothetical protein PF009_g29937 [Phytophthora fragariae]KAE8964426.1 hypothetical protein PF011_g28673 [Phytophthora fragariae]KAE9062943.1 hypothetical protein PF010_g29194 [Phytophthora fragariae]KAE9067026.1 hypothetical protein PF007_g28224 [Phytophthora fragariae]KAE9070991.1 hypothetical protein PF006_g29245 [Phytophthora fragariae]